MAERDRMLAEALAEMVAAEGGRVYYVGGCVRDWQRGVPNKDLDLEVYGIFPERLRACVAALGKPVEKGASFGVLGLSGTELDIAMPRKERRTGLKHTDFAVEVDPFLPPEKAALRRDFTINAMMQDVLTGELLDPLGGREDLSRKCLRACCAQTFVEDPLRVFRAAQFSARFGFAIDDATMELCRSIPVTALSHERVFDELCKALLKADKPSGFFEVLREMGHLGEFFPELQACIGVEQNPVFHPEGDVFCHSMIVTDEAAALRDRAKEPLWFMLGALLHDLGKAITTNVDENGKITSYRHETEGIPLVEAQLRRLTNNVRLKEYVCNMTLLHMRPNMLAAAKSHKKKTRALFDLSVCPEDLILLSRADASGRRGMPYREEDSAFLCDRLEDYRRVMRKPMVTGKDLIAAGYAPGTAFAEMLRRAKVLHFGGNEKKAALSQLMREFPKVQENLQK